MLLLEHKQHLQSHDAQKQSKGRYFLLKKLLFKEDYNKWLAGTTWHHKP